MDIPLLPDTQAREHTHVLAAAPAKLYALLLQLRPIQEGTLMSFSGELVHAAWLSWLRSAAPDVATWLHEGNKRRLFTCSSLQFPYARMVEAERNNIHLPLTPEKIYTIRITLLLGELFPLFYKALTNFQQSSTRSGVTPPFMRLGRQSLLLEEVVIENDTPTGWSGFTSFTDMVEAVQRKKLGGTIPLKLEFASLTSFNRGNAQNRAYGNHCARLPLPSYVFPYLAKRWQELAPPELASIVQREAIEQYILDEGIVISDYDFKPHAVKFTTHWQPGFIGSCTYALRGPDEATTTTTPLTLRQQMVLLARLAFYTGVGYKTAMGMGQTKEIERNL